jgi:sugar lactone lactonase YvrE
MNDIQRLLAAAALVTFTGLGCSSSSGNGPTDQNQQNPPPPDQNPPGGGDIGIAPAANDKQFTSPFDATPSPDGKDVYFTALAVPEGVPAVFHVGADGQGLSRLFVGDPLVSPFGISVSDDGKTLFIADSGAESDTDELGAVFTMASTGGTPTAMAGTQGTLPKGIEALGDSVYYTGITGKPPTLQPAVYKLGVGGGAPTILAQGLPMKDPSGIAVSKAGDVFVLDTASAATHHASVFKLAGGTPNELAKDIYVGYPAGIALSADDKVLIVSALDDTAATDVVFTLDVGSGNMKVLGDAIQKVIGGFGESAGLHRSRNGGVFAWADGRANKTGTVYVLK